MSLMIWRIIGLVVGLGAAAWGTLIVHDFRTDFRRFERLVARREARREAAPGRGRS